MSLLMISRLVVEPVLNLVIEAKKAKMGIAGGGEDAASPGLGWSEFIVRFLSQKLGGGLLEGPFLPEPLGDRPAQPYRQTGNSAHAQKGRGSSQIPVPRSLLRRTLSLGKILLKEI